MACFFSAVAVTVAAPMSSPITSSAPLESAAKAPFETCPMSSFSWTMALILDVANCSLGAAGTAAFPPFPVAFFVPFIGPS